MNYLVSYPRSGTMWTLVRLDALRIACKMLQPLNRIIRSTHLGFHPGGDPEGKIRPLPRDAESIYVLIRDMKKSIVSLWYFLEQKKLSPPPIEEFVLGERGVVRACKFLNQIDGIAQERPVEILFYEDNQGPEFFSVAPRMIRAPETRARKVALRVHAQTRQPINLVGAEHNIDPEILETTDEYLIQRCMLNKYKERYLGGEK